MMLDEWIIPDKDEKNIKYLNNSQKMYKSHHHQNVRWSIWESGIEQTSCILDQASNQWAEGVPYLPSN